MHEFPVFTGMTAWDLITLYLIGKLRVKHSSLFPTLFP